MDSRTVRAIVWAQICFCVGLAVAIWLKPAGLGANAGISYYGIYARTIAAYEFCLLGGAFWFWRAATHMENPKLRPVKLGMLASSLLTLVVAITPYSVSNIMGWSHTAAGSALFSLQLLISIWLCAKMRWKFWPILLTLLTRIPSGQNR